MPKSEEIDTIDDYTVTSYNDGTYLTVCLKTSDGEIALGSTFAVVADGIFQVKRINVFPGHTGKRLAPKLYKYITDGGFTIRSDMEQSDAGKALWVKTLPAMGIGVKVFDTVTNKIHSLAEVPLDAVYGSRRYLLTTGK